MPTELETRNPERPAAVESAARGVEVLPPVGPYSRRPPLRWRDSARKLLELVRDTRPPPEQQAFRLRTVERNIILPVKALLVLLVAFYVLAPVASVDTTQGPLSSGSTFTNKSLTPVAPGALTNSASSTRSTANRRMSLSSTVIDPFSEGYRALRWMLGIYILINIPVAVILLKPRVLGLRLRHVQNIIFFISSLDALFVASLTYLTEGFASIVYWLFPGLIVRNSISLPLARPQLLLNLVAVALYFSAGILDVFNNYAVTGEPETSIAGSLFTHQTATSQSAAEPFLLRIVLLLLLTFCCYGLQALLEKQRQTEEDGRELTARQQQLDVAARLAAQIAHQIKNPLGIINTTIFNLERSLRTGKREAAEHQLGMMREEVVRADQVVTRLMGYAQLKEGRVEKLDVLDELERVIQEVFPAVAKYSTILSRDFAPELPGLWMQRQHLNDIFLNILLNAREALFGQGEIRISVQPGSSGSVQVTIADNGPGIPPERINQIFQPYFTTKEKGSGLGLAIVKQNMNLYGGSVSVDSQLGRGTRFVLIFASRALTKWTP